MSKTSQRKRQAYEEGHRDARRGNGFKYARHPFMEDYRNGFNDGRTTIPPLTMLERFRRVFAWPE